MPQPSDTECERETLLSIQRIASSITKDFSTYQTSQRPIETCNAATFPPLDISFPLDILSPISELQHIPEDIREDILRRFYKLFDELGRSYTSAYEEACSVRIRANNFENNLGAMRKLFQARFQQRCFPMVRSQIDFVRAESMKYQQPASQDSKSSFNTEYTPVLETYFVLNGYPSVAHRSFLAQKSGMTPRQIEVWFQNHRNRAKKEGKLIRRLDSDFPLKQALKVLQRDPSPNQIRLPTPPADVYISGTQNEMRKIVNAKSGTAQMPIPEILCDFSAPRPPHAFPAKMKSCYPDPFPTKSGAFIFPPLAWRRKPATIPIVSAAVDMDEFVQIFHLKLNFSENSRRRATTPSKRGSPPSQPWFHSMTTKPSSAPHPALIQTLDVSRSVFPSLDTFISKPIAFGPNFLRVDTSTAFLPVPPGEAPARKLRPLPRRIPPRSPSSSFGSRTSSFSSDTSSRSITSSSSSSYSSSPELPTPPPLPHRDLPVFHDDAQQQDYLFDFSQTDLDTDYPSASQTFDFSFNDPSLNKIPDLSCFSLHFPDFNNLAQIIS